MGWETSVTATPRAAERDSGLAEKITFFAAAAAALVWVRTLVATTTLPGLSSRVMSESCMSLPSSSARFALKASLSKVSTEPSHVTVKETTGAYTAPGGAGGATNGGGDGSGGAGEGGGGLAGKGGGGGLGSGEGGGSGGSGGGGGGETGGSGGG